jgi:anti-sigma regulatory factor (Ser/Thr protein kinase)
LGATTIADDGRDDLVLAVDEAVANVVDHAYAQFDAPGDVAVNAQVEPHPDGGECIVASVTDRGRWRPCPSDSGYRGRGLNLMKCCTDWFTIESGDTGTRVVMRTSPIRPT